MGQNISVRRSARARAAAVFVAAALLVGVSVGSGAGNAIAAPTPSPTPPAPKSTAPGSTNDAHQNGSWWVQPAPKPGSSADARQYFILEGRPA